MKNYIIRYDGSEENWRFGWVQFPIEWAEVLKCALAGTAAVLLLSLIVWFAH